jgi:hypothetical protein
VQSRLLATPTALCSSPASRPHAQQQGCCCAGSSGEVLENSGADPPRSADWCKLEYIRLSAARKAAEVSAHSAEDDSQEITLARLRQEQNVQLITGHYDAMRTKVSLGGGSRQCVPGSARPRIGVGHCLLPTACPQLPSSIALYGTAVVHTSVVSRCRSVTALTKSCITPKKNWNNSSQ